MSENIELFELELTKDQLHALSTLLPKGFSLELVPKSTTSHGSGSRPSKKLFTNVKSSKYFFQGAYNAFRKEIKSLGRIQSQRRFLVKTF